MEIIIFVVLLVVGFTAGSINERRHLKSIRDREQELSQLPTLVNRSYDSTRGVVESRFVCGSVVVSIDYFKRIAAAMRSVVGGRIQSCETLVDRARREAVLRMKEQARDCHLIINTRVETSAISSESSKKNSVVSVEAYAYGTALKYDR